MFCVYGPLIENSLKEKPLAHGLHMYVECVAFNLTFTFISNSCLSYLLLVLPVLNNLLSLALYLMFSHLYSPSLCPWNLSIFIFKCNSYLVEKSQDPGDVVLYVQLLLLAHS